MTSQTVRVQLNNLVQNHGIRTVEIAVACHTCDMTVRRFLKGHEVREITLLAFKEFAALFYDKQEAV